MKVVITGADGFLGKNLTAHLRERRDIDLVSITRGSSPSDLRAAVLDGDIIYHFAGVNRSGVESAFDAGNVDLTRRICDEAAASGRRIALVFTSSTQVEHDTAYGRSKRAAEEVLLRWHETTGFPLWIFRLPNVFGKWSRPNYNSVVATFCHNIARDLPIRIDDPDAKLTLVYVDDVIRAAVAAIDGSPEGADGHGPYHTVAPRYSMSVGDLAKAVRAFKASRESLISPPVGVGLARALYATYMSYLPPQEFSYGLPMHEDERGRFVEVLKTVNSGQVSFFTAGPGITRGEHYHHSKSEKFLVLTGGARFRFRHVVSDETHEITTSGDRPEVVETVPGWAHSITNVSNGEMVVMLWANETFDAKNPDTYRFRE